MLADILAGPEENVLDKTRVLVAVAIDCVTVAGLQYWAARRGIWAIIVLVTDAMVRKTEIKLLYKSYEPIVRYFH